MHILIVTAVGLAVLAAFWFGASAFSRSAAASARLFIWIWLVVALANAVAGVLRAGIPVINEVGALVPIFGIPAAVAWYLSRRAG